jgi:hypothetical protein
LCRLVLVRSLFGTGQIGKWLRSQHRPVARVERSENPGSVWHCKNGPGFAPLKAGYKPILLETATATNPKTATAAP